MAVPKVLINFIYMPLNQIAFDFEKITALPSIVQEEAAIAVTQKSETITEVVDLAIAPLPQKNKKESNKQLTRGRMSLKDMDAGIDLIEIPDDEELFKKLYYPIGVVAQMFKVNQSLIRFWENEFDVLKPKKNGKGDRLFRPEDVKNLKLIYHLLRERKYTIEGAKDFLQHNKRANEKFAMIESLKKLKGFLNELKANL
jgi:DNA-binding transcriptional MerR regulator